MSYALADVLRQPLRWSQPDKRERIYVLHASSRRMATLTFRSASGSFAIAELEVLPALEGMPERPWLLLFAGYLVVMMDEDAKAGVTIASGHPSDLPAYGRQRWWSGFAPTHTS